MSSYTLHVFFFIIGRKSWRRLWMKRVYQMRRYSVLTLSDLLFNPSLPLCWCSQITEIICVFQKVMRRSQHARKETEFLRLKRTRLGLDDFESLKVIGRGAFGEVGQRELWFVTWIAKHFKRCWTSSLGHETKVEYLVLVVLNLEHYIWEQPQCCHSVKTISFVLYCQSCIYYYYVFKYFWYLHSLCFWL